MKTFSGYSLTIATCVLGAGLKGSQAFVQNPVFGKEILPHHQAQHPSLPAAGARPTLHRLWMAKKGTSGSKRKRKKPETTKDVGGSFGGATRVADVEPRSDVYQAPGLDDFEGAGAPMIRRSGFGAAPPGVLLKDGEVGTDAAREAKIQETLKKMGVKAASREVTQSTIQQKRAEIRTMSERINSVLDFIPAEVQLGFERVLIAGFTLFLAFFVAVGIAIGTEAYLLSTTGEMPKELDDIIVHHMQPYFSPSLFAIFGFSISLGILKLGQMGQESVVYREDD